MAARIAQPLATSAGISTLVFIICMHARQSHGLSRAIERPVFNMLKSPPLQTPARV
ncbi:hypothetical protein D3C81_2229500 [compost metagenome]